MKAPILLAIAILLVGHQERRFPQPGQVLEIILPDSALPGMKLAVTKGGRSMTLIPREYLKVTNPDAASGLTAVDVWADGEEDSVKVRLSMIYNDLSNQEWWKDKKEKILGTYVVQVGQAIRPSELEQFGIEPFEMKAVSPKPVVFPPGKGPRITNSTSLEVLTVEKSLDGYNLLLKNNAGKNVVAYALSHGNGGTVVGGGISYGGEPLIEAGGKRWEEQLSGDNIWKDGITISGVLFADGSFEGDELFAARLLARGEGVKIQLRQLLPIVQRTLDSDEGDLEQSLENVEAGVWKMTEAIDKGSALELLRNRFTHFDEKTVSQLYEELKRGLYDARNLAQSLLGPIRRLKESDHFSGEENKRSRTEFIRRVLERAAEDINKIIAK